MLLIKIILYVVNAVFDLFCMLCLLRIYMQLARVSFVNPIGQGIIKLTNWIVIPIQHIFSYVRRFDFPSFVAAYLCSLVHFSILWLVASFFADNVGFLPIFFLALLNLFKLAIYVLCAIIVVNVIISWLAPHSASLWLTQQLSAPLLKPVQKIIPPLGGLDFSPFIVLLALQVLLIVVREFM